jgi:hypothetical protein
VAGRIGTLMRGIAERIFIHSFTIADEGAAR